jgi:putative phage-type endonuclease
MTTVAPLRTAELFPAAEFTGVTAEERAPWLAMRRTMITASSAAALFGAHPKITPMRLYVDMLGAKTPQERVLIDDPRFWGTALEKAIFEAAAGFYGWQGVLGGELLRSRKYPHLGATLDAALNMGGGWGVYEGKTTSAWLGKDWNEETGAAPTHVVIQAQHQLLVTGTERAIVFCLVGGQKPVKVEIEADPEFHAAILEESERFLEMVRDLIPPPPDGKRETTRAFQDLYPVDNGTAVALPPEALDWTREYIEATARIRVFESRKEHFKQLIMNAVGSATYGVLPELVDGKGMWKWATQRDGVRSLKAVKGARAVARHASLPPAGDTLVAKLEESIERENLPKIRYGQARKRARR